MKKKRFMWKKSRAKTEEKRKKVKESEQTSLVIK